MLDHKLHAVGEETLGDGDDRAAVHFADLALDDGLVDPVLLVLHLVGELQIDGDVGADERSAVLFGDVLVVESGMGKEDLLHDRALGELRGVQLALTGAVRPHLKTVFVDLRDVLLIPHLLQIRGGAAHHHRVLHVGDVEHLGEAALLGERVGVDFIVHFARRAEAVGGSGVVVVVEIGGDERPHLDGVRAVPFPVGAGEGIGAAAEFITFVEFRGKLGCKVDSSHNNFLSYHYVPSYQIDSNSASAVLFPLVDSDPVERALFFSSCALRAASIFCCSS